MLGKELKLEELEAVTGGRQLTEKEKKAAEEAGKKYISIDRNDPAQLKFYYDYFYEIQGLFNYYYDGMYANKFGNKEYLFKDFVKEYGSDVLYKFLYE